jgi:(p)ppGpp synthase/HD superfamily hydrolase
VGRDAAPDPELSSRFIEALSLTVRLHSAQARKGTRIPYLSHLLGVCGLVLGAGGSEDQAIAALLHDAVEDQGGLPTLERIRAAFGDVVAQMVADCSDSEQVPKPPWRARKQAYLDHLQGASSATLLVVAADKLDNLRAILRDYRQLGDSLWARFDAASDQVWYYGSVLEILEARFPGPITVELRSTFDALLQLLGS